MSKNNCAAIFTLENATIVANGRVAQVNRSSVEFDEVVAALNQNDFASAFAAFDKAEAIRNRSKGGFQVTGGVVFRNGVPVHNVITNRILSFVNEGLPFEPLLKFADNLFENPSKRAVDELYSFLEHGNLPISLDGCFFAYKSIGSDWLSKASGSEPVEVSTDGGKTFKTFTGRIPNKVGSIVRIQRNLVDEDKDRTCSNGLHVGALSYAGPKGWYNSSNDHVVLVKVNPKNAVSVPADHSAQKLRVCEYEVIAEFQTALNDSLVADNATPFSKEKTANFRCRNCRNRKKASTFQGIVGKKNTCPRCDGRNTFRLN